MCERIPRPAPGSAPPGNQAHADAGLGRRAFLLGLGGVLIGACTAPASPRGWAARGGWARAGPGPGARGHVPGPALNRPGPEAPLAVVRRAQWGARPLRPNHDPMADVARLTLHHTAMEEELRDRDDAAAVRAIQAFHQDGRGWADIGYHWLIGRDGRVYEGRPLGVQGAHAGGSNNVGNLGVSVIGDFSARLPEPPQLHAVRAFLARAVRRHGLGPASVFGHRDFKATACPGDALYAWLLERKQDGWAAA